VRRLTGWVAIDDGSRAPVLGGATDAARDGVHAAVVGRLDGRTELSDRLGPARPAAADPTDAELILAAYLRWGLDFPAHLVGDFALAVWDERARRMLLARDALGVEDLYWRPHGTGIAFDTRPEALAVARPAADRLDREALAAFLAGDDRPSTRSVWAGVHALAPAHRLVYERGQARCERYWSPPAAGSGRIRTLAEAAEMIRDDLARAVEDRLRDVHGPFGTTLSGGLDSGLVSSLAARARARAVAVTFGFDRFAACDERLRSRRLAGALGIDRIEVVVDRANLLDGARHAADGPFVGWDAAHDEALSRLAALGASVLLTGHGADDLFAGDRAAYGARILRGDARRALAVLRSSRGEPLAALRRLAGFVAAALPGRRRSAPEPPPWLAPGAWRTAEAASDGMPATDLVGCRAALAWHRRRAETWGVEVRHPFLDRRLVERLASIAPHLLVDPMAAKPLLRATAAGVMPGAALASARKTRFGMLLLESLREERDRVSAWLADPRSADLGLVDADALRTTWDRFLSEDAVDLSIWRAVSLESWLRSDAHRLPEMETHMSFWSTVPHGSHDLAVAGGAP
jgi:asparagine synthase (glutamine-hydrolysing)